MKTRSRRGPDYKSDRWNAESLPPSLGWGPGWGFPRVPGAMGWMQSSQCSSGSCPCLWPSLGPYQVGRSRRGLGPSKRTDLTHFTIMQPPQEVRVSPLGLETSGLLRTQPRHTSRQPCLAAESEEILLLVPLSICICRGVGRPCLGWRMPVTAGWKLPPRGGQGVRA